jgi:hypothetical protein
MKILRLLADTILTVILKTPFNTPLTRSLITYQRSNRLATEVNDDGRRKKKKREGEGVRDTNQGDDILQVRWAR